MKSALTTTHLHQAYQSYVDNVDLSLYIGHGNGDGFTFETSVDDSKLTYLDAAAGGAWGNRDLEFQAWLSCQVLEEMNSGLTWYERWGPTFNGLHLICGFQTNAYVGTENLLNLRNQTATGPSQAAPPQTHRSAWAAPGSQRLGPRRPGASRQGPRRPRKVRRAGTGHFLTLYV